MWWKNEWGDIDLVTDATPEEMQKVLKIVGEIWKKYGTCIVLEWNQDFEITTFRKDIWTINNRKPAEVEFTDSLEEDSKRRDLTCNAIYFDVEDDDFIDPEWWIEDIKNNIIRFVWKAEERINEDALRILRFIRFKNKYWFKYPVETDCNVPLLKKLKNNSHLLKNISVERIRQELDKILLLPAISFFEVKGSTWNVMEGDWFWNIQALQDLKDIDFFKHIIPEIDVLETVPWNKYHLEWNVWIHTKMCIEALNKILNKSPLLDREGTKGWVTLYYALLFHDIAKYDTLTFDKTWEAHYYNHERIGSEIFSSKIANRLKFTNNQKKEITWLIKNHIKLFLIPEMRKLKSRKLMNHLLFEKLLIIWEADNAGRIPVKDDEINNIKNIYKEFKEILKTKEFLTGKDIMEKYPELEWKKIWERLEMLNDQIMVKD